MPINKEVSVHYELSKQVVENFFPHLAKMVGNFWKEAIFQVRNANATRGMTFSTCGVSVVKRAGRVSSDVLEGQQAVGGEDVLRGGEQVVGGDGVQPLEELLLRERLAVMEIAFRHAERHVLEAVV